MRKVSDIIGRKGDKVISIAPSATVIAALEIMASQNIGSVVVMDNGNFAGILTERDYCRKVILKGRHSNDTLAGEIMTTGFPQVSKDDTIDTCMQLMSSQKIRYLPVMENGRLAGIISINDVVTETMLNQAETIDHLRNYIQS
ncbi:MAG: CBS domain-containing protein [Sediminibacterium sp.]